MATTVSIILDKRNQRKDLTYPVKLRVYSIELQKAKLYSTNRNMTEDRFNHVWLKDKTAKIYRDDREYLDGLKVKALEEAKNLDPFSFEAFERKMNRKKGDAKNVIFHYFDKINNLKELERFGTAETYTLSLRSILNYIESQTGRGPQTLPFNSITPTFLNKYESFMISCGKTETTVSIYLRALRTIFNKAIQENEIIQDIYPFGKNKYEIPSGNAVKKALTKKQVKKLYESIPATPEQEKAKDFWFLSYICNGMNINDIALLKFNNIINNTIEFKRAKTRKTAKKNQTTIVVHLHEYVKSIIAKYGNDDTNKDNYIFSILDKDTPPVKAKAKIKNFTRFINQHIKQLAKDNGLPEEISTYWARHTFATVAIREGASIEFVKEAFGHQNITTTQNYFAGFEDEAKANIVNNLLKFD